MTDNIDDKSPAIDLEAQFLTPESAREFLLGKFDVILPTPNVRACNNLDEYLVKSTLNSKKNTRNQSKDPSFAKEPFAVPLVRNFQHILKKTSSSNDDSSCSDSFSGMIERPRKTRPDIFSKTDQSEQILGPLFLLKKRMDQVVKVLIRRRRNVPYISRIIEYKGTLVLFDKHMNLYLRDVVESFRYGSEGDILKRARFRDCILIRGDNVILVS